MTHFQYFWRPIALSVVTLGIGLATAHAQTPIAHWTFDDGIFDYSLTTIDDTQQASPGNSDAEWAGTDSAGLTYGPGQIGGAAVLDGANGTDHHFNINAIATLDGNNVGATFSGWFQPSTIGQTGQSYKGLLMTRTVQDSVGTGRNWGFAWENGSNADGRVSNLAVDSGPDLDNDGSWYHMALVWDTDDDNFGLNPTKTLYVNGAEVASNSTGIPSNIVTSGSWWIGQDENTPGTRHFRGAVDDFAIYGEPLSAGQISTLYLNGLGNGTTSTNASGVVTTDIVPGDTNGDGVDVNDYFTIRDNMNTVATGRDDGDVTGDGFVTLDDFAQWRGNAPGQVLALAGFAVPEPGTFALLSLASLLAGTRGRRDTLPAAQGS